MKDNTQNPNLSLVANNSSSSGHSNPSLASSDSESLEKIALSLLTARTTGKINTATADALVNALHNGTGAQTVVQQSVDVSILLKNYDGDASICFKYSIANYGRQSLPSRTHRFWFTHTQININISVSTESGTPLEFEEVEASGFFKEIRVRFPQPLEPADELAYRIQYSLQKDLLPTAYYDITARTLTTKMSMTIWSPSGAKFSNATVSLESADGYISDCPPLISLSKENGRQKLYWQHRKANQGDQFRTRWTLAE